MRFHRDTADGRTKAALLLATRLVASFVSRWKTLKASSCFLDGGASAGIHVYDEVTLPSREQTKFVVELNRAKLSSSRRARDGDAGIAPASHVDGGNAR